MRLRWLPLFLILFAVPVNAQEAGLTVRTTPVKSFNLFSQLVTFGGLEWRGGLELQSTDGRFGGLSGLGAIGFGTTVGASWHETATKEKNRTASRRFISAFFGDP